MAIILLKLNKFMHRTFSEALIERKAVIWALFNREITTRLGDSYFSYTWLIVEPLFFIGMFASMFYFLGRNTGEMPILLFLLTGIVPFFYFRKTIQSCANVISSNKSLLSYRQVKIIDAVMARVILESTISIMTAIICSLIIIYLDQGSRVYFPLQIILAVSMLAILSLGIGLILAILSYYYIDLNKFTGVVFRVMFFTSGVFFSLSDFPKQIAYYISFNPALQAIEFIRASFHQQTTLSPYLSLYYLESFSIISLALGLAMYYTQRNNLLMNDRSR